MNTLRSWLGIRLAALSVACLLFVPVQAAPPKIGVLLGETTSPFGRAAAKALPEAAEKLGARVVLKAPVIDENIGMKRKILAAWEAEGGFDALIIAAGSNTAEIAEALQPFVKKRIPIVTLLAELAPDIARASIQIDEAALNAAAVELCAALLVDGEEVGLQRGKSDGPMIERDRAFIVGLRARHPKINIRADVFFNPEKGKEREQAKLLLTKYPGMKLVYSPYSPATLAMIEALRETGLATRVQHVGVCTNIPPECARALTAGELHAQIALIPRDVIFSAVETAVALAAGQTVPANVTIKARVVRKQDLDSPEIKALMEP